MKEGDGGGEEQGEQGEGGEEGGVGDGVGDGDDAEEGDERVGGGLVGGRHWCVGLGGRRELRRVW